MRARFLSSGSHDFADHELLELLLFYSLPRKNTNELAHSLIERFGSLRRVAAADVDELSSVTGIGKNTAALIKLTLELAARYERELFLPSKHRYRDQLRALALSRSDKRDRLSRASR